MNSKTYREDNYVICPFYKKESSTEIKCTGIVGVHTTTDFNSKKAKEYHKEDFCCGNYNGCPICQENMKNEEAF